MNRYDYSLVFTNRATQEPSIIPTHKMHHPEVKGIDPHLYQNMMTTIDLQDVEKLVISLSTNRAEQYNTWIDVMRSLQNMLLKHKFTDSRHFTEETLEKENGLYGDIVFDEDVIKKMFIIFDKFSRKCMQKYDKDECLRLWCAPYEEGDGIVSLCKWSKQDNPSDYVNMRLSAFERLVNTCSASHRDVAEKYVNYVSTDFVYVGSGRGIRKGWFYYSGFRWEYDIDNCRIKNKLHDSFRRDLDVFCRITQDKIKNLEQEKCLCQNRNRERLIKQKIVQLQKLIRKAKRLVERFGHRPFALKMIKELGEILMDENFLDKLETNPDAIALTKEKLSRTFPFSLNVLENDIALS